MIGNVTATSSASSSSTKGSELDQLKTVANKFEAVFLRQILSSARQSKLGEDLMGSDATDQFRDMQDARLADDMAAKGVFGVADLLVKQFAARVSSTTPAADASAGAAATSADANKAQTN
jgi:flagellar protein FlgJ